MSDIAERLNAALSGRYRIERELGEGGMATVYLAEDLKHHRKVALKVLKPELAAVVGAERFLAEIETTANLQHPHILPLFDSGEADGFLFYVMPFVEGETLRDKLDREKQLHVEEAVGIASDVAEALDYAHRQGVIHRDIKPANILMHEGRPLVADFGIALAVGAAGGTRLTETGLSLGTPYYMSPEQATGDQQVGPASDIYALGCVLYEMLVGDPPYVGSTAQAVLGKIIAGEAVAPRKHRSSIPVHVDAAIRKAVEKLPADRFIRASDFDRALSDPTFRHGETLVAGVPASAGPLSRAAMPYMAVAALLAVMTGWALLRAEPEEPGPVLRVSVQMPEGQGFAGTEIFDLSDDGTAMVYEGPGPGGEGVQLWVRRWSSLDGTPLRGTEGAFTPALSADGREVAAVAGSSVRVISLEGGLSRTVAEEAFCCPAWSPDGRWLYYTNLQRGLSRVPAGGGSGEVITRVDTASGENTQVFANVLPGGAVLFQSGGSAGSRIRAARPETDEVVDLLAGHFPRYSPTGHVLFVAPEGGTLLAAPFDPNELETTGAPAPVVEGLAPEYRGWQRYDISRSGTLMYMAGGGGQRWTAVWIERDGGARPVDPDWTFDPGGNNRGLALSPDGTRLAVGIVDGDLPEDIWIKELPAGPLSRLTYDSAQDVRPRWTPDGQSVTFLSERSGTAAVFVKRADGTGSAELLLDLETPLWEADLSGDGEWLLARGGGVVQASGGRDVLAIRPGVDTVPVPLLASGFDEKAFHLSPDGRWLAYESDETGRNEVYVRPFPDVGGGKWLVSSGGGVMPRWAHSGRELFYVNGAREMVAARLATEPTLGVEERSVLFALPPDVLFNATEQYALYDVSPDDQRFIMLRSAEEGATSELILVQNWDEELRARQRQ